VYSLVGGKLTTFRAFAEQVADKLLRELDMDRKESTREMDYYGAEHFPRGEQEQQNWIERVSRATGLDVLRVEDLLGRYGTKAEELAGKLDPEWKEPLKSLPEYTVGEIRMIAETEQVQHLSDLVRRRTLITLLGQADEAALTEIAVITGDVLGWDEDKCRMEVEAALREANGRA
jgi:glycerol-3-phosphate dehydrogenase